MKKIIIYTTSVCPYCVRAKALFDRKGLTYEEINVEEQQERDKMVIKAGGRRTVPQIFIGSVHVGGCDDLYALEKEGKLAAILN
jgi:glutaredoxin 3